VAEPHPVDLRGREVPVQQHQRPALADLAIGEGRAVAPAEGTPD
jgi:hypothetical protein